MRYEVSTGLTPRDALELAIIRFGPRGAGLNIAAQTNLSLVFQGGGGHIAIQAQTGQKTILELETREWDFAVRKFMAEVSRLPPWWSRWWPRKKTATRPPSFQVLHDGDNQ
jgi:hypothetical protein